MFAPGWRAPMLTLGSSGLNWHWWAGGGWWWPLQARDPGPGDTEHWAGASRRPGRDPGHNPRPERGQRPGPQPGSQRWAADESWLRLRVPSPECACHHSYPVPSDHPLMGSINTGDHMHKHQHKHWQPFLQVRTQTSNNKQSRNKTNYISKAQKVTAQGSGQALR